MNALFMQTQPGGIEFTEFQIKGSESHITSDNGDMGLYVDTTDNTDQGGWKVKITADKSLWNKFSIDSPDLFPDHKIASHQPSCLLVATATDV